MKRLFIVVAFVVLLMFPLVAYADVVVGNEFFDKNREKTEYLNHLFQVNGARGTLSSKEKPGSLKNVRTYENGSLVLINSTYLHNGKYWGIPPVSHYGELGWFPMDELLMFYSNVDFETEYQASLYNYIGDLDSLLTAEEFYIWQWPGSDREKAHIEYMNLDEGSIQAVRAYMDDQGREWLKVLVSYNMPYGGHANGPGRQGREGWVCLSDPGNAQLPAFKPAPEPIPWVYGEDPDWYSTSAWPDPEVTDKPTQGNRPAPENGSDKTNAILIIAICAVGALILIKIFVKTNKKGV